LAVNRIGILAGGGRLPLTIAESVIERGGSIHIVAIEGEADAGVERFPHTWVNWGQVGRMVATLRERADALVIAGGVRRPDLWKLRPDLGFFLSLPQILEMMAGGDDSVLSRVVRFFEANGITVRGAHEVAPDLLALGGPAGALSLDPQARTDADLGFAVRAALGPLDAGQAVVAAHGRVLAIEGAEGTDAMLRRVAELPARAGNGHDPRRGVLAKGPKPGQELRVDMPTIGPRTAELAAAAGLAGIAVEAGAVLLLDRSETVRIADAAATAIEGLPGVAAAPREPSPVVPAAARRAFISATVHTHVTPSARDFADMRKGLAAVERLSAFDTGYAVVVVRAYILAVAAGDTTLAMLERTRSLRQWGIAAKHRRGVLVCHATERDGATIDAAALIDQAAAQGLAGVAVLGVSDDLDAQAEYVIHANRHGLFVCSCPEQWRQ
jgi:DUF1009 family protein